MRFLFGLLLALLLGAPAFAQGGSIGAPNFTICNQVVQVPGNANTLTQAIAAPTVPLGPGGVAPRILICGWLFTNTAATGAFQLTYGTGANCATSPANLTPAMSVGVGPVSVYSTNPAITTTSGQALCVLTTVNTIQGLIWYTLL